MIVGALEVDIKIPGANSLKEKRHVLRSLKDNIRNKFNVAVSEVGHQDMWQRAAIGIAGVSSDRLFIEKEMARALQYIESRGDIEVIDASLEFI
ncbi:MAG: hypothetical protein BWY28_01476 [bacterium ADurb.Bin236]|nr:MAG: hypothetical protein BWY28_01476 [bacterium ADurb.Bin236]HOY63424.1 DUF503 domain-containing protein [bacterium]HPN94960.1 DUF503 domain-containing protein [bacterium]